MILLNDKNKHLDLILQKIKENDGYCPCSLEKNEDTKCNCKDFKEGPPGVCHCGAFIKI